MNGLWSRGSGVRIPVFSLHRAQASFEALPAPQAYPASYSMVTGDSFTVLRRQGRETDYALPFGTNIKN